MNFVKYLRSCYKHSLNKRLAKIKVIYLSTMNFNVDSGENGETWRGVPLTELYGSQTPWGAPEFPLISPSYDHTVLYHISSSGYQNDDKPPKPQRGHDRWDHDYVRMPCSPQSLYPVEENGNAVLKKRWELIEEALSKPIENSDQLAAAILSYNTKLKSAWSFRALHKLFNEYLEEEETQYFFSVTLPEIAKLALALPRLIQAPIPLLKQHNNRALSLSQQQAACLLANAFFCTFPRRMSTKSTSEYASYPHINFNTLYNSVGSDSNLEKLKCICHYFRRVCIQVPTGVITFVRRCVVSRDLPRWSQVDDLISTVSLHVNSAGTIEDDGVGLIQVDFANKYIGGGVLGHGCVQEEIRFMMCVELVTSMLFTEMMLPNEAVFIIGAERYSKYAGYAHTFRWAGDFRDVTPRDGAGRRRVCVLAVDAHALETRAAVRGQCEEKCVTRELNKAWTGLSYPHGPPSVATGNWGCGAFGGHPPLKFLLQAMAAVRAQKSLAYYTFNDVSLRNQIINMYNILMKYNVTVGQLYNIIIRFSTSNLDMDSLYPYIYQAILDQQEKKKIEHMDISASSDNAQQDLSPDLFSQDGASSDDVDNSVKHSKKLDSGTENKPNKFCTRDNNIDIGEELNEIICNSPLERNLVKKKPKETSSKKNDQSFEHTSKFFSEMEKIDNESGNLNLHESHQSVLGPILNKTTQARDSLVISRSEINIEESDPLELNEGDHSENELSLNISSEVKKKMTKKITDYFRKK